MRETERKQVSESEEEDAHQTSEMSEAHRNQQINSWDGKRLSCFDLITN